MEGGARFRPLTCPPPLFRLSTLGGARELVSVPSAVVVVLVGTGVAVDSDDLSAGSGACMDGVSSSVGGVGDGLGVLLDGKRERWAGERRKVMRRRFLDGLVDGFDTSADVDIGEGMADEVVMAGGDGGMGTRCAGIAGARAKLRP